MKVSEILEGVVEFKSKKDLEQEEKKEKRKKSRETADMLRKDVKAEQKRLDVNKRRAGMKAV